MIHFVQNDFNSRVAEFYCDFKLEAYCQSIEAGSDSFQDSYDEELDALQHSDATEARQAFGVLTLVFMSCRVVKDPRPGKKNPPKKKNHTRGTNAKSLQKRTTYKKRNQTVWRTRKHSIFRSRALFVKRYGTPPTFAPWQKGSRSSLRNVIARTIYIGTSGLPYDRPHGWHDLLCCLTPKYAKYFRYCETNPSEGFLEVVECPETPYEKNIGLRARIRAVAEYFGYDNEPDTITRYDSDDDDDSDIIMMGDVRAYKQARLLRQEMLCRSGVLFVFGFLRYMCDRQDSTLQKYTFEIFKTMIRRTFRPRASQIGKKTTYKRKTTHIQQSKPKAKSNDEKIFFITESAFARLHQRAIDTCALFVPTRRRKRGRKRPREGKRAEEEEEEEGEERQDVQGEDEPPPKRQRTR